MSDNNHLWQKATSNGVKKGFTLIELLVGVAVFVLIFASASGIFVFALKAQRRSLASQQLLDQTSYLMEYMSRAVRMAQKDISGACTGTQKLNYAFAGQCLKFRNYHNQCQQFCLSGGRLIDGAGNYLTSDDLAISSFQVQLSGQTQDDALQPKVTVFLDIRGASQKGEEVPRLKIQTTISQRNLDVPR